MAPRRPQRPGRLRRFLLNLFLIALIGPPLLVLVYRFVPPPVTILMLQRAGEHGISKDWRSLDDLDADLVHAAIAAEDANFCTHNGFDVAAIRKAMANNERRPNRIRGGSTISQQTAKNVFLWPQRSWVRKGAEAYFTLLIETLWPKRRIMEVYLNVVEMGPGVYGAEAAARKWFGKSAEELSRQEAARLIAILPSPRKYKAASPGPYVRRRAGRVQAAIRVVRDGGLSGCVFGDRRPADRGGEGPPVRPAPIDRSILDAARNPDPPSETTAPAGAEPTLPEDPIGDLLQPPADAGVGSLPPEQARPPEPAPGESPPAPPEPAPAA